MEVQSIKSNSHGEIRTLSIDNVRWFVWKDVANVLGYCRKGQALNRFREEDKGVTKCDTLDGKRNFTIVSERGLQEFLQKSRKGNASKKFMQLLTPEPEEKELSDGKDIVDIIDALITNLNDFKEELKSIQTKNNSEILPQNESTHPDKDILTVKEIAEEFGWSAKRLNAFLQEKRVQHMKKSGKWVLYKKYEPMELIYKHESHTYWTPKGRLFIHDLLKKSGVLPLSKGEE